MFHVKHNIMINDQIKFEDTDRLGDKITAIATHKDTFSGVFTFNVSFYINDVFKKSKIFNSRTYSNLNRMVREYMFNNLI